MNHYSQGAQSQNGGARVMRGWCGEADRSETNRRVVQTVVQSSAAWNPVSFVALLECIRPGNIEDLKANNIHRLVIYTSIITIRDKESVAYV